MSEDPRSTRSRKLVFTLYGDYLRDRADEVWVGSLIQLLAPLGMSAQAVRSTLSRMQRRGWFTTHKRGRHSYYALTVKAKWLLDEGEERLFAPGTPQSWDGRWHLASYSVPEARRELRDRLRQRLVWLGFGQLSPGTWISPYPLPDGLLDWLRATGAGEYADVFVADYGGEDARSLVARAWNLDGLERTFRDFIRTHRPLYEAALNDAGESGMSGVDAFARRFDLTQEFLDFPYVDPGLPPELLPPDWPGEEVRTLFREYHSLLASTADAYVDEVIEAAPKAAVAVTS